MIDPTESQKEEFFATDQSSPVVFINCHRYYPEAKYSDDFNDDRYPKNVSGREAYHRYFKEVSSKDTKVIIPLLLGTIFLLLFLVFRSFIGVILPTAVIILSIISTFGVAGYIGVQYNSIISAVPSPTVISESLK